MSAVDNPFYSHEFHGDYELISIGRLDLEEGESIPDCQLAVATFGTLSAAKDNVILVSTWYSGTHQIWRDAYIGPDTPWTRRSTSSSWSTRSAAACPPPRTTPAG